MEHATPKLVEQRVRNRIIEVLECFVLSENSEYPDANELINMWEDWVDDRRLPKFSNPVFSTDELRAINDFHSAWNVFCANTPNVLPELAILSKNTAWCALVAKAKESLSIFLTRGLLSESEEIT